MATLRKKRLLQQTVSGWPQNVSTKLRPRGNHLINVSELQRRRPIHDLLLKEPLVCLRILFPCHSISIISISSSHFRQGKFSGRNADQLFAPALQLLPSLSSASQLKKQGILVGILGILFSMNRLNLNSGEFCFKVRFRTLWNLFVGICALHM